jgi:hypothetical protein
MDIQGARQAAERILGKPGETMGVYDARIATAAFAITDANHDFQVDRMELTDALASGRIKEKDGHIVPAALVFGDAPAAAAAGQAGLAPAPWMQGAMVPGGTPGTPPAAVRIVGSDASAGAGQMSGTMTTSDIKGLAKQGFSDVAGKVKTPEDVALLLGTNFTYDSKRLESQGLALAAWSASDVQTKGTGICRDQHALARDLLKANGYNAVLLGYSGSDQSHAIAAYQDKTTGEWGIVEYGTLYPASQLHAKTPEEALLMVRPTTMAISVFSDDGPDKPSHIEGIVYTPTSRVFEQFMSGPSPTAGTGATVTNEGISVTASSNDRQWQAGMKIVTDPRLPYLQGAVMVGAWHTFGNSGFRVGAGGGYLPNNTTLAIGSNAAKTHAEGFGFVSAEEFHPQLLHWGNVGGSGINVDVGSQAKVQAVVGSGNEKSKDKSESATPKKHVDIEGMGTGLSSAKWNPSLTVSRDFSVWGRGVPDTRLSASYGLGIDGGLIGAYYASGGKGVAPVNQYVTAGITTRPTPWLGLSAEGYAPITNATNDYAASPMARFAVTTPYATLATTQGKTQASYEASTGVNLGPVQVGAFASAVHDRQTGQVDKRFGAQATVLSW